MGGFKDSIAGMHAKLLQSSMTLCNPMDCSLPGSSVHVILQVRILELVAISSRVSSSPRDQTHILYVSCIGRRDFFFTTSATWEALITGGGGDLVLSHAQLL